MFAANIQADYLFQICKALKRANVEIYSGPKLSEQLTFGPPRAEKLAKEYGGLACTVEIVPSMEAAVDHIHRSVDYVLEEFITIIISQVACSPGTGPGTLT